MAWQMVERADPSALRMSVREESALRSTRSTALNYVASGAPPCSVGRRYEHPPLGALLLRRAAWRHQPCGAQHALRHPATGGQQPDPAAGGGPRRKALRAPALQADARG